LRGCAKQGGLVVETLGPAFHNDLRINFTRIRGRRVPSAALIRWQNDRMSRLNEVDAHCAFVLGLTPSNPRFLDETLRGFVLHLSAHFQGFCRDLYTECSQIWIAAIPAGLQATAQAQFSAELALAKRNPSYDNIKRDFNRFGFLLNLPAAHAMGPQQVTDLGHLNDWRNKAAHQGTQPLGGGVPAALTVPIVQGWRVSCDGLATSLDSIMHAELLHIMGIAPW
jgi:hypothetical protein